MTTRGTSYGALVACCIALAACGSGTKGTKGTEAQGGLTLTVGPAGAAIARGGTTWLDVSLTHADGVTGDWRITVPRPPAGASADVLVFPPAISTGAMAISLDLATDLLALPFDVVAASGSSTVTAHIVLEVADPPPTVRALISDALAAGTIDLATSLLYRCYARFGDDLLPEAFRGAGEEDLGLLDDIAAATPELSAEALAALQPYIVRPADPASVYATAPDPQGLTTPNFPPPADCAGGNAWRSLRSTQIPVRVWIECQAGVEEAEAEAMVHVLGIFEKVWPSMSQLMGAPILDAAGQDQGGDDAIDVYLVRGGIRRAGETHDAAALTKLSAAAYTCPSAPFKTNGSGKSVTSGFIVAPRLGSTSEMIRGTLVHELFHVFQSAHNRGVMFRPSATPKEYDEYWFVEASAVWAKVHYDRTLSWPAPIRGIEHGLKFGPFELSSESLSTSVPVEHTYQAYAWPLFLEQLSQSDEIIGNIWRGLERAGSFSEADDILDGPGPFATNFHEFALRNLNQSFLPGDPLPLEKRYVKLDDLFPDQVFTPNRKYVDLKAGTLYQKDLSIPPLGAAYFRLTPTGNVAKVELDLTGLQPEGSLDVDALIKTKDGWVSRPITLHGKEVFCFDDGPSTETLRGSFTTLELVLSNHAHATGDKVAGLLRINPTNKPCGVWVGTARITYDSTNAIGTSHMVIDTNATFAVDDTTQGSGDAPYSLQSGDYTYRLDDDLQNRNPPCRSFATASGPMVPAGPTDSSPGSSFGTLQIISQLDPPTYFAGAGTWMEITSTSNCNDQLVDEVTTGVTPVQWWQSQGSLDEKGTLIHGSQEMPDGMGGTMKYEWNFQKMRQ